MPVAGPIGVDLPLDAAPSHVRMQPGNRSVEFRFMAGRLHCQVDPCGTHEVMVVDLAQG